MIGLVLTCGRNLRPQVCNMLIVSWFLDVAICDIKRIEEFESAIFSLFKVAICDLELLQTAPPMRRFQFARRVWRIYTFCISPLVTDGL